MRNLFIAFFLLFPTGPVFAQSVTYEEGSVYDLDPPARQSTGNRILEQVLQSNDMQPVLELGKGDIFRRLARPVGRLALRKGANKISYCTASLIADDLILTNHHCIRGNVKEAVLWMGYLKARSRAGVAQYRVIVRPVEASKTLDYAVLRVRGRPGREWGKISLSSSEPGANSSLFIIHHPGGFAKQISRGRCQTAAPAIDGTDIMHLCDTMGGSSGAPIFDNNSQSRSAVIGLHYSAVSLSKLNAGKRIASIAKNSPLIARLVRRSRQSSAGKRPVVLQSRAALAWGRIGNTKSCAILRSFIKRYKGSEYADYATARRRELSCGTDVAVGIWPKRPEPALDRLPYEPEVVHIPGGTFRMGCVSGKGCQDDEKPVHRVTISQGFYLSKYETTFAQWDACVADGGCKHKPGDEGWGRGNRPVINVSWDDAVQYAKWLSRKTGQTWRLPTEAEWEYAARSGTKTKYSWGNGIDCGKANYGNGWDYSCESVNPGQTKTVGSFSANKFGLHDMHGNVWEWVSDWYGKYKNVHQTDPKGPRNGSSRVFRGGSWLFDARFLRSAYRDNFSPDIRYYFLGFRLLRQPS